MNEPIIKALTYGPHTPIELANILPDVVNLLSEVKRLKEAGHCIIETNLCGRAVFMLESKV